jgi:hypothetical protein
MNLRFEKGAIAIKTQVILSLYITHSVEWKRLQSITEDFLCKKMSLKR